MDINKKDKRKEIICDLMKDEFYVPMKEKELASFLGVTKENRAELTEVLNELLKEGKIMLTIKGKYMKSNGHALTGSFMATAKGFGFVRIEGDDEDYYIAEDNCNGAFHKDIVEIAPIHNTKGRRREARVIKIVERGIKTLVGTFEKSKDSYGFLVPDDSKIGFDIFIPKEWSKGAVSGHKCVVEITDYGTERKNPEGKVIEIIGHENDPGVDILSIVRGFDLPMEFDEKVLDQAERVAKPVSEADMAGRKDLRDLDMVTIDGEDAKDLDDAVSASFDGSLYHLGVHIADVTNYVQENSALDREAFNRGTSVYLVDRVIPMLPHVLSNGMCSLNAGEDRLALSCLMTINSKGEILDHEICESVIRVNKRMSYTQVNRILTEERCLYDDSDYQQYIELAPMFNLMRELSLILRERRTKRGAINFDFPECKILLDRQGHPIDIHPYERNVATDLIEDFMLAANETVAEHFFWLDKPFVYRVHATPDNEKLHRLAVMLAGFGYSMKTLGRKGKTGSEEIHPKEIQRLLERIAGTPEEPMIARLTLRSMMQAKYSVECDGHFGLACQYYCHFTSPIRRYPDLQIHRIIKDELRGRLNSDRVEHYRSILSNVAKHSSETERRATEAERETDKLKKCEYMSDKIGQEFDGIISGVTAWGIYVELPDTVEGMVHVSKLPGDYYYFKEETMEMVGDATGRTFRMGMPVRVVVDNCDMSLKTIDFSLVSR